MLFTLFGDLKEKMKNCRHHNSSIFVKEKQRDYGRIFNLSIYYFVNE